MPYQVDMQAAIMVYFLKLNLLEGGFVHKHEN